MTAKDRLLLRRSSDKTITAEIERRRFTTKRAKGTKNGPA